MPRTRWYQDAVISTSLQFTTMWSRRSTVNRMARVQYERLRPPRVYRPAPAPAIRLRPGPAGWPAPPRRGGRRVPVEMRPAIAYGPLPAEQGDLYLPALPKTRRPAVVVIHGGGWVSGQPPRQRRVRQRAGRQGRGGAEHRLPPGATRRSPTRAGRRNWWMRSWPCASCAPTPQSSASIPHGIGSVGDSAGGQLAVFLGVCRGRAGR